jgi:hypothetical protein
MTPLEANGALIAHEEYHHLGFGESNARAVQDECQLASLRRSSMFRDSQWIRCLCLAVLASSAQAQTPSRSPKQIGEIIHTALQAVIPPEKHPESHAMADVAGRKIRLDYPRTMAAFGLANNADVRAELGLTHAVTEGSTALLEDCDQMGMGACKRLGRSAYAYVEPISISDSEAKVRVHVVYVTTVRSKRTYLSTWITEVILTRSGSGPWRFLRLGKGMIS